MRRSRLGDAVVAVSKQIDRCVMTTRPQPGGIERDVDVLRTINRTRANNLGIATLVRTPGTVRVGDPSNRRTDRLSRCRASCSTRAIGPRGSSATAGGPSSTARPGSPSPAAARPSCCSPTPTLVDDDVRITLPDGSVATDDAALSAWLGRPVHARTRRPTTTSGTFEIGSPSDDADRDPTVEWYQWEGPVGTFHDSTRTQVSIIGAGTRRRLGHAPLPARTS